MSTNIAVELQEPRALGRWERLRDSRRRVYARFGLLIAIVLLALVGPFLTPYDPEEADPGVALRPPSWEHWFGTNSYGADIFARTVAAGRLDVLIASLSVGAAFAGGAVIGVLAGYSKSWAAGLVMRVMDFVQSFPLFIIAMALVAVAGPSIENVIIVLTLLSLPIFVRLANSEVVTLRDRSFVEAARCIGNSNTRVALRHILPNALGSSIAQAPVSVGWALLLTAGLSFVGAGVQAPQPELGLMIAEGAPNVTVGEWWISVFPGLALGLTVLAFSLAGDALHELFDRGGAFAKR